uniref:Uncharacterized protein n=1 Tax=Vespula pensylvanica TaxID=30213 RepID=A0A834P9A3_VESPE|nr:hypothetical protein H0235_005411 [Vespula pensylvanica]
MFEQTNRRRLVESANRHVYDPMMVIDPNEAKDLTNSVSRCSQHGSAREDGFDAKYKSKDRGKTKSFWIASLVRQHLSVPSSPGTPMSDRHERRYRETKREEIKEHDRSFAGLNSS